MKKIILLIIFLLLLCVSCKSNEEIDETKQKQITEFSNRVSLFNALEDTIELIDKKDYIKADEELEDIFIKSNQIGYISNSKSSESIKYINTLNNMANQINQSSLEQKKAEIKFESDKSFIKLLGEAEKESGGESEEHEEEGTSGSTDSSKEEDSVIIYEQELVEKYPEAAMTDTDYKAKDQIILMLDYVTGETLLSYPDNEKALINREKYLLYQVESFTRSEQYTNAIKLIDELNFNWQKLMNIVEEIEPADSKTILSTINNLENAIKLKDKVAIKIQCSGTRKELEKQLVKQSKQ